MTINKKLPKKELFINRIKDIVKCDNKICFNSALVVITIVDHKYKLCDSCLTVFCEKIFNKDFETKQTKLRG